MRKLALPRIHDCKAEKVNTAMGIPGKIKKWRAERRAKKTGKKASKLAERARTEAENAKVLDSIAKEMFRQYADTADSLAKNKTGRKERKRLEHRLDRLGKRYLFLDRVAKRSKIQAKVLRLKAGAGGK